MIGYGGFSTVYRGYQQRFDRTVAVKVLHVDGLEPVARRRFERECAVMGRLSGHPYIVTIYDAGVLPDGRPFLITEFCPGGSLADLLATRGPINPADVVDLGSKLVTALQAAQQAAILHRDIKPANILVRASGQPALADFGLSIRVDRDTSLGIDALSPEHAAPESLVSGTYTAGSDVYALGSTLYTALAGHPPFPARPGEGPLPYLDRVRHHPVPDVSRPDVPPELGRLLQRMLAKNPADRPALDTVATELAAIAPSAATAPTAPLPGPPGPPRDQPEPATASPSDITAAAWPTALSPNASAPDRPSGQTQLRPPVPGDPRQPWSTDSGRTRWWRHRRNRLLLAGASLALLTGVGAGAGVLLADRPPAGEAPAATPAQSTSAAPSGRPSPTTTSPTTTSPTTTSPTSRAPSATPTLGVPAAFAGTWSGLIQQPPHDPPEFPLTLSFTQGLTSGTFRLPTLKCEAVLTVTGASADGRSLTLDERLVTDPDGRCAKAARLVATLGQPGTLRVTWQDAQNADNRAEGVLRRQ